MDLSTPLRTISPGLDAGVLTALAGTEAALSATAIARLAGYGTRNGQAPVLDRLVRHGLVLAEPGNLGHLYRLNRQHILAPTVLAAIAARGELLSRLRTALDALGPSLTHGSVFGSFARGTAGPDSDIDLLLITAEEQPPEWHDGLVELRNSVRAWTGNDLETPLPVCPQRRATAPKHAPDDASRRRTSRSRISSRSKAGRPTTCASAWRSSPELPRAMPSASWPTVSATPDRITTTPLGCSSGITLTAVDGCANYSG